MRRNTLAILAACAAVTIGGQAQAQQPAAAPAAVPDQMPFDIPYGNSITADRAADVVKAIVAEATEISPQLEARHFRRRYAWRARLFLQDGQHAARLGDDLAEQGADGGAPSPPDADLQQRDANSAGAYIATLDSPPPTASPGGIPLIEGGKIIGAVGCSGATGDQDAAACKAGADTVK